MSVPRDVEPGAAGSVALASRASDLPPPVDLGASTRAIRLGLVFGLAAWTLLVGSLVGWSLEQNDALLERVAGVEGLRAIELDLLYRRWATSHGGVYVPVSPRSPENPYLEGLVEERDLVTPSGRKLTLVNPAYMTRQVHELDATHMTVHITSLKPLNPKNAPDAWDRAALESFERGARDRIERVVDEKGEPSLRILKAMMVEKPCLKCHAKQGYAEGEVRGGLGAIVELEPYILASAAHRKETFFGYGCVWLLGISGIFAGGTFVRRRFDERARTASDLREREERARVLATELREKEARLIESQRVSRVGSYVLDVARGTFTASEVLDEIFGIGPDYPHTIAGWLDLLPPETRTELGRYLEQTVIGEKKPFDREYPLRRWSDGQLRIVHGRGLVDVSADGRVVALRGTIQDITERKHLETRLFHAQKMEAVGQLAGGVAHDFNNILAAMMMQTGLLQGEPNLPEALREGLLDIEKSAQRAADLTRQLLLFGRRQIMRVQPIELNALLVNLLKMLRRLIGEKIELDLRASPEPLWINADAGMIEQVVLNLCVNARDAMPNGGKLVLETRLATSEAGEAGAAPRATLSVTDTGSGMDAHTLEHLFEPFFTTKPQGKGSGLGLAIVDGIVEQHRGRIDVESTLGVGSSFHISLPLGVPSDPEHARPEKLEERGGSESVLLVEDEEQLRSSVARWLGRLGYRVTEAATGEAALEAWARAPARFDLVLTDMMMPGALTGLELVHRLRVERPGLRAILMSGYSVEITGAAPLEEDDIHFVSKPFEVAALGRTVRSCLDGARPSKVRAKPAAPPN